MRTVPRSVAPWLRVGLAALLGLIALTPTAMRADTDLTVGGQAHVAYSGGDNVRLRTGPSYDNDTIEMVPDGTTLDVLDGPFTADDGSVWYQVSTPDGSTGYVVSDYLAAGTGSSADAGSTAGTESTASGESTASAESTANAGSATGADSGAQATGGTSATVTTTLNLRAGPSLTDAVLLVIPSGATVTLTGESQDGFQAASYQGTDGWVFGGYLDGGSAPAASSNDGSGATTTDALNLRDGPSYSNGIILVMPAGATVTLTGESENGFLSVDYQGTDGWAVGSYLDTGSGAASGAGNADTTPSTDATSAATASGQSSGGNGQAIVNYAMQYLGYPYVAATHGPDSFDCSGFTYWVVLHVLGIDIGTGLPTQVAAGTPVAESDLQPGDLVFFQNTYEAGLSHVGIYIGNDQFIHAENPSTGVVISSLSDPYYQADWYGAVRLV